MKYLLESTVCITIFYGLYYLIFRRLTFVRLNRIYLLSSLVIGLSLPLVSYQIKEVVKIPVSIEYEETNSMPLVMNSFTPSISNTPLEKPFDWNMVLQGIYLLGIALMFFKLIYSFRLIVKEIILKSSNLTNSRFQKEYISTQSKYANSSFFNLIFIDDSNLSVGEINQILAHEKWHIRLFHSYDLLFVELLKIIFWFNPILLLYQRSLSEVHEYEVDTRMIKAYNPQMYAQLLLKLATATPQLATTHQFSRKPLTDRIHFLFTKQKSVPMKRLAYLSVLPILGAFFMAFSVEKVVDYQEVERSSKYFKIVRGEFPKESYPIKIVDKKIISTINLSKNKIGAILTSFNINNESIEEAAKYFNSYGFKLDLAYKTEDLKSKGYEKLEVRLTEHKDKSKLRILNGKPSNRNQGVNKDALLEIMRSKFDSKQGNIVLIIADKSTGRRTINILMPPPPPPAPPKSPLPPVKLGMNTSNGKMHGWDKNKIANFAKIMKNMLVKSNEIVIERQKIDNGLYMSNPITQKKWQSFLDYINKDTYYSSEYRKKMVPDNWNKIKNKSDKLPVTFVSFEQATEYCNWKSKLLNYKSKKNSHKVDYVTIITSKVKDNRLMRFRLPTEEEWQMAAKRNLFSDKSNQIGFYTIWEMPYEYLKGF